MRVPLEAGDRTLLIVAGVLLVAMSLAALIVSPHSPEAQSLGYPSSYSTANDGAKAAYLLLTEMGYRIERSTSAPGELPERAQGTVLVLADPLIPASGEEKLQIERFIRRGGRVVTTGWLASSLLPATDIDHRYNPNLEWQDFRAQQPGPLSQQAMAVSMKAGARWGNKFPAYVPYFGDEHGAVVVASRLGHGTVIWWASSGPLTNYGLTRAANLRLLLNSVGPPTGTHVLWDEYFHGVRAGFWDYLGRTPVPWALAQLGVLFLCILLTYGRRSGPIAVHHEESRLSPLEFVETMGDLYERKRAPAGAVEAAFRRFRSLLERRLGLAPSASIENLERAVSVRAGRQEAGLLQTLRLCDQVLRGGRVTGPQAMALVQSLHDHTRRLRLGKMGG